MARKSRRRPPALDASTADEIPVVSHESELTHSPFAELEALKKKRKAAEQQEEQRVRLRRAAEAEAARKAAEEAAERARVKQSRRGELPPDDLELDDAALFARAMDGIDQADLYQRKFATYEDPSERLARQRQATRLSPEEAARMAFEQEMRRSGVERIGSRRIEMIPRPSMARENIAQVRKAHAPETDDAPAALDGNAKKLLERARKQERQHGPLPAVTLRGLSQDAAIERLRDFLETQSLGGVKLVRVITGKGKQSDGEPVLKHLAPKFFESRSEVSLYAPELGRDGEFGAFVVQLRTGDDDDR